MAALNIVRSARYQRRGSYFLILLQLISRALDLHKLAMLFGIVPEKKIRDPRPALGIIFAENPA
jgi:hypothetical protein